MAVTIRLLGPPAIEDPKDRGTRPRGRKGWALLGYLRLADRPVSRQHLAELLFGQAEDPLGALRWTLTDLRRALGVDGLFRGDPVSGDLGPEVGFDLDVLSGPATDPDAVAALGGELLEGLHLSGCAAFESWLVVQRHRISAQIEGHLRQSVIGLLAEGRSHDAVGFASRAVALNPLDEGNHELLVRCLATSGDRVGALRQVAVCEDLLRRELGVEASAALREAAERPALSGEVPVSGQATARSLLEAGRAAVGVGAVEAGLDALYRAVDHAAPTGDRTLHGQALVALGGALVHGVRGRDGEGSIILQEAAALADRSGDRSVLTTAYRELGFVDVQAGRRATAEAWLDRALAAAESDSDRAAVLAVRGMNASDRGNYGDALCSLRSSIQLAGAANDPRQEAWSLSILARAHLLRHERSQADEALSRSLAIVEEQRWLAFLPWPQSLRAELDLQGGRDPGPEALEAGWALSCQLSDPCWQGMTARALGLYHAAHGDHAAAVRWLDEGYRSSTAVSDRYQWVVAFVLDARARLACEHGSPEAADVADELASLAARCEMAEFVVRAHLYRWRLGDETALAAARLLARDVDNPALQDALGLPSSAAPATIEAPR